MTATLFDRLAVCSWSLQAHNPRDLVEKVLATGLARVQLALDPLRTAPEIWAPTVGEFDKHGITIVSGMFGCVGEDYSTLETIRATGGIAPDATWPQNRENVRATARLAQSLGLKLVTFHAGFLPHDPHTAEFYTMVERLQIVADMFAAVGTDVGLETGQESAADLAVLLRRVNRPNLGVNFDPANIILYGRSDVIGATRILGPWLRQVHIKDAIPTVKPGSWGQEVAVGTGAVDWNGFFQTLKELNFAGNAAIEREGGSNRIDDICAAKSVVEKLLNAHFV
jgi:sugar phosphate isomerase/epimerase